MTYKQIEEQVLQLLFAYTVHGTRVQDGNTRDLCMAMPAAMYAAEVDLAQSASPIVRALALPQPRALCTCAGSAQALTLPYPAKAGGASLMAHGPVEIALKDADGATVQQQTGTGRLALLQQLEADGTLVCTPQAGARIACAAVWQGPFARAEEVPLWRSDACGYDLAALTQAVYGRQLLSLSPGPQAVDADGQTHPFTLAGEGQLYVQGAQPVTVYVHVLPQRVDEQAYETASPEIAQAAHPLIAYAVAAQLIAEDDLALAQQYRQQYELQKQQRMALQRGGAGQPFACESGWLS